jgi:hypothetical protein
MAFTLSVPNMPTPKVRTYTNLAGVDYAHLPSLVDASHSPDALNVYKNYASTAGQAIETRLGFTTQGTTSGTIYGIHRLGTKVLIHHDDNLVLWSNFPTAFAAQHLTSLSTSFNKALSVSFVFGSDLYILDGANYWVYNGNTVAEVTGYIPTTRINADPDGANGEVYQGVNLISDYRYNTFIGDGTSDTFYLDEAAIDNESPTCTVNGASATVDTFSTLAGTVKLASAPADGAEVKIKFKKAVSGNGDKIKKCTLAHIFDGRVFFSGNPES